jgi:hypothetical protein
VLGEEEEEEGGGMGSPVNGFTGRHPNPNGGGPLDIAGKGGSGFVFQPLRFTEKGKQNNYT